MHMKNLGYMLLVALLLCCTCVQCSEKEHQTPPALSEGDDPGGDGGEENPEGLPGYPKGLTVDEFTQELANGSKCLGFYAIVDFKANPNLRFRPQFSAAKKPTAYFSAFAESGDGTPYLAVNGGFFGGTTSVSLLIDRGVVRSLAVQEDWIWSTNPYTHFFPVRAALGQLRDGSFEAAWVYCVADDDNCPYAFPSALGNNEKTMTFMPAPPTSHTAGGRRWQPYNAIGGGPMLVHGGRNVAEENYWKEIFDCGGLQGLARHPRTAIGATEDGKLVIVVCDGQQAGQRRYDTARTGRQNDLAGMCRSDQSRRRRLLDLRGPGGTGAQHAQRHARYDCAGRRATGAKRSHGGNNRRAVTRNPILYGRQAFCRPFLWCAFIHFCPKFVKKRIN